MSSFEISDVSFESNGPVLGIYFIISSICVVFYLDKVEGKIHRLDGFLAGREWHLIKSAKAVRRINVLVKIVCYAFLTMPPMLLIFWAGGLIRRSTKDDQTPIGGVAVLLIGSALLFFLLGVMKIKWNRYRLSRASLILLLISGVLLVTYQVTTIFLDDDVGFFGVSSIFLATNAVLMIFLAFINSGVQGASMKEVIELKLEDGEPTDTNRGTDFEAEIDEAEGDAAYVPSKSDVFELFTLPSVSQKTGMASTFGGGLQRIFSKSTRQRRFISFVLYFLSLATLFVYALLIYLIDDDSRLGAITAFAVVTTDVILYLYIHAEIASSPSEISVNIVVFRTCLFILGGNWWIYGYCILYIYLGLVLSYNIGARRFPLADTIVSEGVDDPRKKHAVDVAKTPEFILGFTTLVFVLLIAILEAVQPKNVPLNDYELGDRSYPFYAWALFSVLAIGIIFALEITYRIYRRKRKNIQGKFEYYVVSRRFDQYWFFMIFTYGFIVLAAIMAWYSTDEETWLAVGIIGPLALILLVNAYVHYVLNDYNVLQNIEKLNKRIVKHNSKMEKLRIKVEKYKREAAAAGAPSLDLQVSAIEKDPPASPPPIKKKITNVKPVEEQRKLEEEKKKPEEELKYNEEEEIEEGGEEEDKQAEGAVVLSGESPREFQIKDLATMSMKNTDLDFDDRTLTDAERASRRFKLVHDWRKDKGFCRAMWSGSLRRNDYNILLSLLMMTLLLVAMAAIICGDQNSLIGITITVPFFHYIMVWGAFTRPLATDSSLRLWEILSAFIGFFGLYVWGIVDYIVRLDADSDDKDAGQFVTAYVVGVPFITSSAMAIYKWLDDEGKFSKMLMLFLIASLVQGLALVVLAYIVVSWQDGLGLTALIALLIYGAALLFVYTHNNYYMPFGWQIANAIIGGIISFIALIVSIVSDDYKVFSGFSTTYLIICIFILFYSGSAFYKDYLNRVREPVYYSPWIFPIYKYDSERDDIRENNGPVFGIFLVLFLGLLWSVLCSVWIAPYYYGIAVSALCEVLLVIFVLFIVAISPLNLRVSLPYIDNLLLKRAWLQAKRSYVNSRNAFSMDELITYKEIIDRREAILIHLMNFKRSDNSVRVNASKDWNIDEIDDSNYKEVAAYLFNVEREATKIYSEELELIIMFELLVVLFSQTLQAKDRKFMFKFLNEKKHVLHAAGIMIHIPQKGSLELKMARVVIQVERLSAEKQMVFKRMKEMYVDEEQLREQRQAEKAREEEEKEKERMERLKEMSDERRKLLENFDRSTPVNTWPDCLEKYQKLIENFKASGEVYADS